MRTTIIAALALLLSATSVHAQVSPTSLTCGSSWSLDKKYVDIQGSGPFTYTAAAWLVCDRYSGFAPARLVCLCDKSAVPDDAQFSGGVTLAGTFYAQTQLAKCSTSSGCGTGTSPSPPGGGSPPPPQPTATSVVPVPTRTAGPGQTSGPTAIRTATVPPVQPTPPPQVGRRAPAGRSAYWQVSLLLNKITPVKWCYQSDVNGVPLPPFTPTQVCMQGMVRTRMIGVNDALRAARDIPACASASKKVTSATFDSEMNTTLDPIYRRRFDAGRGVYVVDTKGPDYKKAQDAAEQFQKCMTSKDGAALCAQHPAIARTWDRFGPRPPDLLADFLTLHVENGRCVKGAEVPLPVPNPATYDKTRLTLGHVELDGTQPMLSDPQLTKLAECEHLHHLASEDQPMPAGKSVRTCHLELEDLARNDRELGFLSILPFSGTVDPTITAAELPLIKRYEHRWYGCWAGALRRGDWEESDQCSVAHFAAHDLRNYKDPRMLFRFPCNPTPGFIRQCPIENWAEVLLRLARESGGPQGMR